MMDAANEEQLQEQKNKEKKQDSNEDEVTKFYIAIFTVEILWKNFFN